MKEKYLNEAIIGNKNMIATLKRNMIKNGRKIFK